MQRIATAELDRLAAEFQANLASFETLCAGLSHDQFNWRSQPGTWSIAQCLAHLNAVDGLDIAPLSTAISAATVSHPGPYKYPWIWRWFIGVMEPPVKMKVKAPKKYVPPPGADLTPTLVEYRRVTTDLLDLIRRAEGLDLGKVKTTFPAVPILTIPIGARFALIAAHDRRHLWQARNVRNHPDFPRS